MWHFWPRKEVTEGPVHTNIILQAQVFFQISFLMTVHCGIVVALKRTVINDRDEIILRYKMHGVLV